jgi:hypothetical protein
MAPQSARRDRKNQCFPPCYRSTLLGDLDPVRELPYGLAALIIAAPEAGQMAASDQVSPTQKSLALRGASTDGKQTLGCMTVKRISNSICRRI